MKNTLEEATQTAHQLPFTTSSQWYARGYKILDLCKFHMWRGKAIHQQMKYIGSVWKQIWLTGNLDRRKF